MKKILRALRDLFWHTDKESSRPPAKIIFFRTVPDPMQAAILSETLRTNSIYYELRGGKDFFLREDEIESAGQIAAQGNWT